MKNIAQFKLVNAEFRDAHFVREGRSRALDGRPPVLKHLEKNRNSRLPGHVNFDGQNHCFVRKGYKNGFISGLGQYFPDFGYLGFASK